MEQISQIATGVLLGIGIFLIMLIIYIFKNTGKGE